MPVTIKFEPNTTQQQAAVIPDATPNNDGVMSKTQATSLTGVASSRPPVPSTRKTLLNGQATPLIVVDMTKVSDNSFASVLNFAAEVTDGTNVQIRSGNVNANVAKASNGTYATSQAQNTTVALTAGTLTLAFSWVTTATTATLQVTPTSSLTPSEAHIDFYIPFASHPLAVSVV